MTGTPPVPAAVRARIDLAMVEAERLLMDAERQPEEVDDFRRGFIFQPHAAVDRTLVPATVTVLSVIVDALSEAARRYAWTADRLRATVDHCLEQTTAKLFAYRPHWTASLEDFRRDVLRAARKTPWWSAYLDVRKERSVAIIPFHLHLQAVLAELGWGKDEFAKRTDVDRTGVYDHFNGKRLPSPETVRTYEKVLSEALGWPVTFVLPPKTSRAT